MSGVVIEVFPREGGLQITAQPTRTRTSCLSTPQQINHLLVYPLKVILVSPRKKSTTDQ